ncbi:hypothetical protein SLE2022_401950 [Rubroshorea leprosula]
MRTRFLNVDYFSSSPVETSSFLNLPVPHLLPHRVYDLNEAFLRFDSLLDVSLEIEPLPINSALSKFISEVIPHFIDVDFSEFEVSRSPSGNGCFDEHVKFSSGSVGHGFYEKGSMVGYEVKELQGQRSFISEFLENDNETAVNNKDSPTFEVIGFEVPELDSCLDKTCFSEKEIEAFSEVPDIEHDPDMLKIGLIVQYPDKIQESVDSVEYVALDYNMEQNAYILEDENFLGNQAHSLHCTFPTLEVDELILKTLTSQSVEDVFLSVFKHMESQLPTSEENQPTNSKELLGSIENDFLKLLSDGCLSKQFPEPEQALLDFFTDMDLVSLVEIPQMERNFRFDEGMSDGGCFWYTNSIIFEEFQMFESNSSKPFEVFLNKQTIHEPETYDWLFREDMSLKNFNELIVSPELSHIDDMFKSLPVPVLSDHARSSSLCAFAEELLSELKPLPLFASDGIYLDWHILEEDKCKNGIQLAFQNMVEKMDLYSIDFGLESSEDQKLVSDFIFSDNGLNKSITEQYEEVLNRGSDVISLLNGDNIVDLSVNFLDSWCSEPGSGEELAGKDAKRASMPSKFMPQFSDLDFFLNPEKAGAEENAESAVKEFGFNATLPKASNNDSVALCASNGAQPQHWDIIFYNIKLSDCIVALIDYFEKSYLAILQNETELNTFFPEDNFILLSIPKQKLMDCVKKKMTRKATSPGDEDIMAFVTLSAIKQMAWYLCFYGIHTTHLYIDKLCRSLGCLKSRLGFLHSVIHNAYEMVDREITRSHPSLSVIQGILQPNTSHGSLKALILADRVFWCCLKKLFISMGLSCNELLTFYPNANPPDTHGPCEHVNIKMDIQLTSDCLLVSHEHVSAAFPFHKFNLILEYGGPCGSSRVSSFSPKLVGLPHLHFLKVELQEFGASRALCEGVDMPQDAKMAVEGDSDSTLVLDDDMSHQKLEELLNFVPIEGMCTKISEVPAAKRKAQYIPPSVSCSQPVEKTKHTEQRVVDTVIVVNTQNFDKEMIISRRRTYQKILAMEKEGAQILERDSDLPVDVIISSAISLVWYNCRNIGKKATGIDEMPSSLPLCIENIAANVLMLLSFSFSGCFMVFEGEIGFLSTIMESSAGLYAAAASLGIDFQLFCSYSSELTDEIILNCIKYAAKLTRSRYPRMPESETLAESFLTRFPSINPLTAHAILSSVGMLIEFLEWSHDLRACAIQNYSVPDESIALFVALCKYAEREDAKSIMTDSSSASSGLDSDKCLVNVDSQSKRQKYNCSPKKIDISMDDLMHFGPMNQCNDDFLIPAGLSKENESWMSKDHDTFQGYKKPGLPLNDLFGPKQEFGFTETESPQISSETKVPNLPLCHKHSLEVDRGMKNIDNSDNWCEDFTGKVIYITDSPLKGEDLSYIARSLNFSSFVPEMEKDSARKSKTVRRLSFDHSSHLSFPTARESGSDVFTPLKYPRQSFQVTNDRPDTGYNSDKLPLNYQENLLEEALAQGSKSCRGSLFKKEASSPGGTLLSKAILSAHPQPGSPWTIEFLNRIREKSRLRQQSLPPDTSLSDLGLFGKTSKVHKRRNPYILDFFKYQGGSTPFSPQKIPEEKKRKLNQQPSSSSTDKKSSPSLPPTWTRIAKRGRPTLSFTLDGSGNQTKLIWSNGTAHASSKKCGNK